jgi:hypothetical protein
MPESLSTVKAVGTAPNSLENDSVVNPNIQPLL